MIDAYWWRRFRNFGDAFSPLLLQHLSGQKVRWSRSGDRPVLAAVGSIVQSARPGWHVWGSGLIAQDAFVPSGLTVHAVRGPRTRAALATYGYPSDVPLGDPALLLPVLFPSRSDQTYDWGIIPHFIDYPLLAMVLLRERFRLPFVRRRHVLLINPLSNPRYYIRRLTACRHVAASSLHGLIAADAYGIPNVWFATARNALKAFCLDHTTFVHDDFKYYDYFDSVGRTTAAPSLISGWIPWEEWEMQARQWSPIRWDPLSLLESFPHKRERWTAFVRECAELFSP